jgi:hypothetical protein
MGAYRRDIDAASRRLAGRERRLLRDPRFGDIEYAEWGEGPPMIVSHPLFAGFDAGAGLAETYIGGSPPVHRPIPILLQPVTRRLRIATEIGRHRAHLRPNHPCGRACYARSPRIASTARRCFPLAARCRPR